MPIKPRSRLRSAKARSEELRRTPRSLRGQKYFYTASTLAGYERIGKALTRDLTERLELEDAPVRVFRWVAYGTVLGDRINRLAIAMHLRTPSLSREGVWAWPQDTQLGLAEAIFHEERSRAVAKGKALQPTDLDVEALRAEVQKRLAAKPVIARRSKISTKRGVRKRAVSVELTEALKRTLRLVQKYAGVDLLSDVTSEITDAAPASKKERTE